VVRFGRKQPSAESDDGWALTPAEILEVSHGLMHTTSTGIDAVYDQHSASTKLRLRVAPAGAEPYEATLKIDRDGPATPDVAGTTLEVLVDPSDPQHLSLPADPTYTLPGGQIWRPEHGLAGEIAAAKRRGDTQEIQRLAAEARAQGAGVQPGALSPGAGAAVDPLDRLDKLSKLHDSGALTDEEFQTQKEKILRDAT
jgi:hypothetical protein